MVVVVVVLGVLQEHLLCRFLLHGGEILVVQGDISGALSTVLRWKRREEFYKALGRRGCSGRDLGHLAFDSRLGREGL